MVIAVNARFLIKDQLEGIGWYTYEIVRRMAMRHPEDEFILFFDRPYDKRFLFDQNVKPVVLFPPARHPLLWWWWFEWSLASALKRYEVDVLFSPDGYTALNTLVPSVMVTHDIAHIYFPEQIYFTARKYYQYLIPRFLDKAAKVITVSEFVKEDILRHYSDVSASKIEVIYNGCREGFRPIKEADQKEVRKKYAEGQPYFFYVGAVQPRKNIHRLIEAFDIFKQITGVSFKLLIAGRFAWQTGPVKTAYTKAVHQKDIVFLGYVPDEDLPLLMGAAFALTYISLFEGFGLPLVEAMQCNIPIITSEISSMPEVAGNAALLVDPASTDTVVQAMQQLYEDENLYRQLVEAGELQRRKFSWDMAAESIYTILKNV